jgi:hypothetical protein
MDDMERRIRFFEQMRQRLDTINEEGLDTVKEKIEEKKPSLTTVGKQEYMARVKTRLNAWASELDRWEAEACQVDLNEECLAQLTKLDNQLIEGYEKMRDLMGTADEDWCNIQEDAEKLWEEILLTFDQIRYCVGGGMRS